MKIILSKLVLKQLTRLKKSNNSTYERVLQKINGIQNDENLWERLTDVGDIYKIRVWSYRILYSKQWIISVEVIAVETRGRVYRKLK